MVTLVIFITIGFLSCWFLLYAFTTCDGTPATTWFPDLRKTENRGTMAILVKF